MQARSETQSRTFRFPSSSEDIEIVTYKNPDGTFKNSETIVSQLKRAFLELNDFALNKIDRVEINFYNLRIVSPSKAVLIEMTPLEGSTRMDYESERVVCELVEDDLDQIKELTISCVTAFLDLFSTYYQNRAALNAHGTECVNNELTSLLRFSNGAKIKFLEELMSLYLALNGQTYFDVVANILMSGAYTFGSLFSTTGLYYAANSRLIGKGMLHGAIKRSFGDNVDSRDKGEIYTTQGLVILHLRQFRLRQRRATKVRADMTYEPIAILDDDLSVASSTPSTPSFNQGKRLFERVKNYKLLNYEGIQKLDHLHNELVTIVNEPDIVDVVAKLKHGNLTSVISIMYMFDHPVFEGLNHELEEVINHTNDKMIYSRLTSIDMLGLAKHRDVVRRNAVKFLAMVETAPSESDVNDSIVQRFNNVTEPTELVMEYLNEFLDLIG